MDHDPVAGKALQQFMVDLTGQGFLLCLCSKNDEADVLDVFDRRPDMVLKRDHLVSWRINWQPKSREYPRDWPTSSTLGSTASFSSTTTRSSAPRSAPAARRS